MSVWKRKRLGASYVFGVQRRQIRVGCAAEPVVVIRVLATMQPGDELVLTRRDVKFAAMGLDYAQKRAAT